MVAKELLTSKKIADQLGLTAGQVTRYIKENSVVPDEKRGNCAYYGPKTVKAIEKALFLSAGNVAKQLGAKPAVVTRVIQETGIEADKVTGSCKYYGPGTVKAIKKALP